MASTSYASYTPIPHPPRRHNRREGNTEHTCLDPFLASGVDSPRQQRQRVITRQVSAQQICICQVSTQCCFENSGGSHSNMLLLHFLQAFTRAEECKKKSKEERGQQDKQYCHILETRSYQSPNNAPPASNQRSRKNRLFRRQQQNTPFGRMTFEQYSFRGSISGTYTKKCAQGCAVVMIDDSSR